MTLTCWRKGKDAQQEEIRLPEGISSRILVLFGAVKKLQPWIKAGHLRRARWRMARRTRFTRRAKLRSQAIAALSEEFYRLPQPAVRREEGRIEIDAPRNFSLRHNYNQVVGFFWRFREEVAKLRHIKEVRNLRGTPMRVNFKTIQQLSPAAALVLAAEIDRWRRDFGFRPIPVEIEEWNGDVRERLIELGLFDLLDVPDHLRPPERPASDQNKMIRFLSEIGAPGAACEALKRELEVVAGAVPARTYFHDGVSEAMANVGHHAYPAKWANPAVPWIKDRWWATGAYRPADGSLRVVFYDQGVGIPATLPTKRARHEKERGLFQFLAQELSRFKTDGRDHARLIAAALMYPRSSTGEANRGNGLQDIRAFVDNSRDGTLRIISGRGEITYRRGGKLETQNHPARFTGTLIEWEVFRDARDP